MELAILLGVVFFALVGAAVVFGRRGPVAAETPIAAVPPADDATGEPAATRDRASWPKDLFRAAALDHALALDGLLTADARVSRVDQLDASGWTPLHHAAYHDAGQAAEVLLARGANPDAVAEGECVPLHMAAAQGSLGVLARLLEAGADPNAPDEAGATPLHYGALPGRLQVVEALIAGGAAVNLKDARRETALDMALRLPDPSVAERIREAGGRPGSEVRQADVLAGLGDAIATRRVPRDWRLDAEGSELAEARRRARAAMPALLMHLAERPEARAAVKFALRDGEVVEHVWGEVIETGQPLIVRLSAPPDVVPAPDGPVQVGYDEVVDWQVQLDDGRTAGGYSQRATWEAIRAEYGFLPPDVEGELARLVDL